MTPPIPEPSRGRPAVGLIRLGWAALLLAVPDKMLRLAGGPADSTSLTVARVLGARHAIQGTVEVAAWPRWRRTGSAIDAAHSLTAIALGITDSRWRRLGLTDGVIAATFAVGGLKAPHTAGGAPQAAAGKRGAR